MYKLIIDKEAAKFIEKLENPVRKRIRAALLELAEAPYSVTQVKRLVGRPRQFRKRVGDFRIIYEIIDQQLVILVLKVAKRDNVYKD